jgi:hypothetical protein
MRIIITILFSLFPINLFGQYLQTLNTSNEKDDYSEFEIKTLMQINFTRTLNKLRPLKTNQTLNHFSKLICNRLQEKNIDTSIKNTLVIYFSDSLNLDHPILKDTFHLIGIHKVPHRFNCEMLVITLDRKMEQIKWRDLDCPKFMRVR